MSQETPTTPDDKKPQPAPDDAKDAREVTPPPPEPEGRDGRPNEPQLEVSTQTSPSDIQQYIQAAAEAGDRSRRVLIVLITASVLTLVATWNSRPNSWASERYELANAALVRFDAERQKEQGDTPDVVRLKNEKLYESAGALIKRRHITEREVLLNMVNGLEAMRLEHVRLVRMPFFGMAFDVNDLGLFAGITFVVVLLWFRFSLLREVNNIRLTFHEAERQDGGRRDGHKEQLRFCYDMLAMRQVLTTPQMEPQDERLFRRERRMLWFLISKILFALPLGVYCLVMYNDWKSYPIGAMVSPDNAWRVVVVSWVCFVCILGLTLFSYGLVYRAQRTWSEAAKKLLLK